MSCTYVWTTWINIGMKIWWEKYWCLMHGLWSYPLQSGNTKNCFYTNNHESINSPWDQSEADDSVIGSFTFISWRKILEAIFCRRLSPAGEVEYRLSFEDFFCSWSFLVLTSLMYILLSASDTSTGSYKSCCDATESHGDSTKPWSVIELLFSASSTTCLSDWLLDSSPDVCPK